MGWEKSVLAVCLITLVVAQAAFAEGGATMQGQAVACFKDSNGVETCVPASQITVTDGAFAVQNIQGGGSAATSQGSVEKFKNIVNEPVGPPAGIPPQNVVPIMFYGNLQYPTTYYLFNLLDDLKEEYGDKIRVEYRPVYGRLLADGEYVNDELVHEAGECARDQGKLKEFAGQVHDSIGQVQDEALLEKHVRAIGLDVAKFGQCVSSGEKKGIVSNYLDQAMKDAAWTSTNKVLVGPQSMWGTFRKDDYEFVINSFLDGTASPMGFLRHDDIPELDENNTAPLEKHFQMDKEVGRALDYYANKPDEILHLKVTWWQKACDPSDYIIGYGCVSSPAGATRSYAAVFQEQYGAVIEGIDAENFFFYATIPAGKIDAISRHYGINISFDDRYLRPPLPPSPTPYAWPSPTPTPSPSPSPSPTPVPTAVPTPQTAVEETVSPITANVITVTVSNEAGEKTATVSSEPEGLTIESQGVKASVANGTQVGFGNAGIEIEGKPLGVLPDQALATINPTPSALDAQSIELKTRLFQPVYEVSATKKAKMLGILPVEYSVNAVVNAQDGSVESMQKPWWEFLAR